MMKMKQATLFSLKSWIKVSAEDIRKYKDALANFDATESEILKVIVSLKKKNLSRDVVLSAGIDSTLEQLEKHPSPIVRNEAHILRNHWQLSNNSTPNNVSDEEEPPSKKRRTVPEIEIKSKQLIQCIDLQSIDHSLVKQLPKQTFVTNKTDKSMLSVGSKSPKTSHFKSPSINKAIYNINHKLCDAIRLFTAELGEQEVRLYLEKFGLDNSVIN